MTSTETLPEPSGPGSVVLDIGDDCGAAVVTASSSLAGSEVEIRQIGQPWDGRHVAVRERRLPGGSVWACVFSPLSEGDWQVRRRDHPTDEPTTFTVAAGKVTTVSIASPETIASGGH